MCFLLLYSQGLQSPWTDTGKFLSKIKCVSSVLSVNTSLQKKFQKRPGKLNSLMRKPSTKPKLKLNLQSYGCALMEVWRWMETESQCWWRKTEGYAKLREFGTQMEKKNMPYLERPLKRHNRQSTTSVRECKRTLSQAGKLQWDM